MVAFNDLKGMLLFNQYLGAFEHPKQGEVSAHAGQWRGIHLQIHRFVAGLLHEAFRVIDDELTAIGDAEVKGLLASPSTKERKLWSDIIEEAQNSPEAVNQINRAMLARLRNKSSFHYDRRRLREAFQQHFASPPMEKNANAYYSAGVNMIGTRYYFADAAAEQDYLDAGPEWGKKTRRESGRVSTTASSFRPTNPDRFRSIVK